MESSTNPLIIKMRMCEILILTTLFKADKVKGKAGCICAEWAAWSGEELRQQQLMLVFSFFVTWMVMLLWREVWAQGKEEV